MEVIDFSLSKGQLQYQNNCDSRHKDNGEALKGKFFIIQGEPG